MDAGAIVSLLLVFFLVVVPILGITARLAIKPMVNAIIRLRESFAQGAGSGLVERRVLQLEDELRQVRAEVQRLAEAEEFQRELLSPPNRLSQEIQ
jgi:TolA-binding protein